MVERKINKERLTMRIGRGTMAFCVSTEHDGQTDVVFEPYVVKSGVSMAANLREAFKTSDLLLSPPARVRVLLDADTLVVPVEQFEANAVETLMAHAFPQTAGDAVYHNVVPDLNCVALFAMNRDLRLVIDDHFRDVQLVAAATPVWRHLHQRSYTGAARKLFAYFHERQLSIVSFQQNRFRFCNTFDAARPQDALYFMLYVWKQLQMDTLADELHLVGDLPDERWLLGEVRKFLKNVYVINPQADFASHPATLIKGMPYDLQTLFVKGR